MEKSVKEIKLVASVSNIVKFEKTTGKSLIRAFSGENLSFTTLIELVQNLSVEPITVEDLDEYVKKNGFDAIQTLVMNAMEESGFLPKDKAAEITEQVKA